jgi:hypothetical protein
VIQQHRELQQQRREAGPAASRPAPHAGPHPAAPAPHRSPHRGR